jgi:hypothetical protein
VAALAVLVPPYVALRLTDRARDAWASDPAAARADFGRAGDWNPLSPDPLLTHGALALDGRRFGEARRAYRGSLAIEETWSAHFQLALLAAHEGRFGRAARELAAARRLNAHDPLLANAAEELAKRRRIDPPKFNRRILASPIYSGLRLH